MKKQTVAAFDFLHEAHLLKGKLESEGLQTFLQDEHMVGIDPLFSQLLGGIKVQVMEGDVTKAYEIINGVENAPITDDEGDIILCPQCGSNKLWTGFKSMRTFTGFVSAIIMFVLFVYPLHFDLKRKCKECMTEFE